MELVCDVCVTKRKSTQACSNCDFKLCKGCFRTCLTTRDSCPACHLKWDNIIIKKRAGNMFFKKQYRQLICNKLVEREIALLPTSTHAASVERQRRVLKTILHTLRNRLREERTLDVFSQIRATEQELQYLSATNIDSQRGYRCAWTGCNGLVDAATQTCFECKRATCKNCGNTVSSHDTHTCLNEDVESMNIIKDKCKACVNCGVPSLRTEGCSIVWCFNCHVFWHWEQRQIIDSKRSVPHNPDHRAWIASIQGGRVREVGDIQCGGLEPSALHRALMRESPLHQGIPIILAATESIQHAHFHLRNYYQRPDPDDRFEKMRISFLLNDYEGKEKYGIALEREQRKLLWKHDVAVIIESFVFAGVDIVQKFCSETDHDSCGDTVLQMLSLWNLTNEALEGCKNKYDKVVPILLPSWKWKLPYQKIQR